MSKFVFSFPKSEHDTKSAKKFYYLINRFFSFFLILVKDTSINQFDRNKTDNQFPFSKNYDSTIFILVMIK